MSRERFEQLEGEARLRWRENVLSSMVGQMRNANRILTRARFAASQTESETSDEDRFENLLRASGYLHGGRESLDAQSIRVVFDEEQRRNATRRTMS